MSSEPVLTVSGRGGTRTLTIARGARVLLQREVSTTGWTRDRITEWYDAALKERPWEKNT